MNQGQKEKGISYVNFHGFNLYFSRLDFQAFNFLQVSGTSTVTRADEMIIATLQDRNPMIS